ncbi:hypothetical protein HFO72_12905 [Rhizobium laguerreae]|uniref:hypothetical protein n=1 Tax=Rhizobium laguerreae TaxID=1076926 RepID=UPI001C9168B7|nr:hypothetical protein [Rhizobium laguerreae]MBY3091697.1 hypothetical protein [Rhizobium laguerreae]
MADNGESPCCKRPVFDVLERQKKAEDSQMVARVYEVTAVAVDFTLTDDDHAPVLKVSAEGFANSGGWSNFELGVWSYVREPDDGILGLDFLAMPPPQGTVSTMGFVRVSAGLVLSVPGWVKGIRVHASTNQIEAMLEAALPFITPPIVPTDLGLPLPWPFPWYRPDAPAKAASTASGGN